MFNCTYMLNISTLPLISKELDRLPLGDDQEPFSRVTESQTGPTKTKYRATKLISTPVLHGETLLLISMLNGLQCRPQDRD